MDENTTSVSVNQPNQIPLGMGSFNAHDRQLFGQNVRLAMAFIDGTAKPTAAKAMPADTVSISQRLKTLSQDITSSLADLIELLVRFDELEGWKNSGAKHCTAWMNYELGISTQLGWEYLRVGRQLRQLPTTTALFRAGKLSWSKVRLISRVATAENEKTLCHAALDASVTEVTQLCCGYRWREDKEGTGENDKAMQQHESRSLTWNQTSLGCTRIQLLLPPEVAQAFLNSVEHSLNQLEGIHSTISQRRADAAVLVAETSLQFAGQSIATADRYQVIVSVDESTLKTQNDNDNDNDNDNADNNPAVNDLPEKRPTVSGAGPIANETARRIACDCSITTNTTSNGEPVDIGRKSRIWPASMARAIKERDQHCMFPGCSQSQHLQIHHIKHWADEGTTCMTNGVCVCSHHHTVLHEGGYSIQRVDYDQQRVDDQFTHQKHDADPGMFDFEKDLRNDRASFEKVRTLSPTRYRFRVVDSEGRDIRKLDDATNFASEYLIKDSTRVECAEPSAHYFIGSPDAMFQREHWASLH